MAIAIYETLSGIDALSFAIQYVLGNIPIGWVTFLLLIFIIFPLIHLLGLALIALCFPLPKQRR